MPGPVVEGPECLSQRVTVTGSGPHRRPVEDGGPDRDGPPGTGRQPAAVHMLDGAGTAPASHRAARHRALSPGGWDESVKEQSPG